MSDNQPKKLNLKKICLLIVSATMIVLGRFIVEFASINLYLNNFIPSDGFLFLTANTFIISWVIRGLGIGLLCYVAFTSHFHLDRTLLKREMRKQLVKAPLLVFAILGLLMISGFVEVPLARANLVNTMSQGWKITISMSYYDWWIGKLSDNTYFAMNGSDGNMLTFVEPWQAVAPWGDYTDNSTALVELALANIDYGVVYLKEVAFDLALMNSIPENVKVACSYQDQYEEFINPLDTTGSPYQIEVGQGVTVDNYIARDSQNRICFTSTNSTEIFENAGTNDSTLLVSSSITIPQQVTYTGRSNITIDGQNIGKLFLADNVNLPMFECDSTSNIVFKNLDFDGNLDGQVGTEDTMIEISTAQHFQFLNNYVIDSWGDVVTGNNAIDVLIDGNYVENPDEDAFHPHGGSYWKITNNHIVDGEGVINFYCDIGQETTDCIASGNTIINSQSPSAAFRLDGPGTYRRITIINNDVINPLKSGVSIDNEGLHEDIDITENTFVNGAHGIWVAKTGVGTYVDIDISLNKFINQSLQGVMVERQCQNLKVSGNIFNHTNDVSARIHSTVVFTDNIISHSQSYGARLQRSNGSIVSGNLFQYNYYSALYLYGTTGFPVRNTDISGNVFRANRQANTGVHGGILINDDGNAGAGCYNNIVNANNIFDDQVTPTQGYGIIESGQSFNNSISNNMFRDHTVSAISIIQTSNVTIRNNDGYLNSNIANPFSGVLHWIVDAGNNATITNDWIYTNLQSPKTVYVSGGTVTAITVNGQATGLTSGSFRLEPFDTFQITCSDAPTLKVMKQ